MQYSNIDSGRVSKSEEIVNVNFVSEIFESPSTFLRNAARASPLRSFAILNVASTKISVISWSPAQIQLKNP